jgi:hypothetical protein
MKQIDIQGAGRVLIPDSWTDAQIKAYILELKIPGQPASKPAAPKYELTIDWSLNAAEGPTLTGDVEIMGGLLGDMKPPIRMVWKSDEFWHVAADQIPRVLTVCAANGFAVKQIGKTPPPHKAKAAPVEAGVEIVSGTIERVQPDVKYSVVTLVTKDGKKPTWKCFSKTVTDILLKHQGKVAEVIIQARVSKGITFANLVGLKMCAGIEYDEDGKTPIIQRSTQEPGKTLFGM